MLLFRIHLLMLAPSVKKLERTEVSSRMLTSAVPLYYRYIGYVAFLVQFYHTYEY
jgi:hypothetical protein